MSKGLQKIYSEIPRRYELINHLLTLGLDIVCRKKVAKMAVKDGGQMWLDVCTGTGETAMYLKRFSQNGVSITGADFSLPMVLVAAQKPENKDIPFVISEAGDLPFPSETFDTITISFATRNLNTNRENLIRRFTEFNRVLKPGGVFYNLETSQPRFAPIRKAMHLYVGLTVKQIGAAVSGNKSGYTYLAHSIPRFYNPDELAEILKECGFSEVSYKRMFLGITAVHRAVK